MEYSKIVSVTGLAGLYELVASKADGAVVKSLEDKSSKFVSSRVHNFTHLESIEIYTVKDNTVLAEVFKAIKNSKETLPDTKADGKALKSYFDKVYPDLDFERVYASDMKKIIKWYSILTENNIEIKDKKPDEENDTTGKSVIEEIKNETPVPQEESEKNSK
ncbi:MAG: DUF5606 domain-containing protein [Chitinophagaceae bacterium]|nr:DUF5606 domain-containing protein [Chitinophagaceae bacterium]